MNRLVLFISFILLTGVSYASVSIGEMAPDFTLTDSLYNQHTLSNYKGKTVVLEWLNPDCPFVRKHYDNGDMQSLQKEFTAKDVVWLSINSSAPGKQGHCTPDQAQQRAKEDASMASAILLDSNGEVGRLYNAKTTPHMYIIDEAGTLIYQGAIDSIPSANPADVKEASNYVSNALNQHLSGQPIAKSVTKAYGCSVKY